MLAIAVAVRDVVDQVHDAGQQAEDAKGGGRPSDRRDVEQTQAEQQPREDQQILRPLAGTKGNQEVQRERTV